MAVLRWSGYLRPDQFLDHLTVITKVGNKVFVTERMHCVQTETFRNADGRVVLSPSTITKWYKRAVKYVSLTPVNDKRWSSIPFQ